MSKRHGRTLRDDDRRDESGIERRAARPHEAQGEGRDDLAHQPADPATIARELAAADGATRLRTLERLQHQYGNRYVRGVVEELAGGRDAAQGAATTIPATTRTVHLELGRSAGGGAGTGIAAGEMDTEREAPEPELDEDSGVEALDVATATPGATETIGPEVSSTYALTSTTLADVATEIGARTEAGHVGWTLGWTYAAPKGVISTVNVTADITLEMPAWTPPSTMLPKAKAEWNRAYAALLAHENGHIKLVHDIFDGLAAKLLGKTPKVGKTMFATAKAKLDTDSKAYDKKTDHGRNTGTIIDVAIEQQEIDEAAKKKKAAEEKKEAGAAPG